MQYVGLDLSKIFHLLRFMHTLWKKCNIITLHYIIIVLTTIVRSIIVCRF